MTECNKTLRDAIANLSKMVERIAKEKRMTIEEKCKHLASIVQKDEEKVLQEESELRKEFDDIQMNSNSLCC